MSRGKVKNITGDSFFAWDGDVLVVNILGKPSAAKDAIGKPKGTQLKVSVTAAPVAGKATDHMLRFLAPHFGLTAADIEDEDPVIDEGPGIADGVTGLRKQRG